MKPSIRMNCNEIRIKCNILKNRELVNLLKFLSVKLKVHYYVNNIFMGCMFVVVGSRSAFHDSFI